MSRYVWESPPDEVRAAAEPYLLASEWILPPWCRTVRVAYIDKGDGNSAAEAEAEPQYRVGIVRILPPFLGLSEPERQRTIMHELIHIAIWPLTSFTDDLLDRFAPPKDGPLAKRIRKDWTDTVEGVTEDFAWALTEADAP